MTIKETTEAILAIGPTDEIRQEVSRSFFGTLLGRATAGLLLLAAYFLAWTLIEQVVSGEQLQTLEASVGIPLYWPLRLFPLVLILAFSILPTAHRAWRERQLYPLAESDSPPRPGYFRLSPYETSDSASFQRPDDAVDRAVAFIKAAESSVLYLTGASGAGKSSLLNAGVIPALRAEGWRVLSGRGLGKTYDTIASQLASAVDLFDKPLPEAAGVYERTTGIGRALESRGSSGLLIVIDQFEEFLILESEPDRATFAALLTRLDAEPVAGVKLLLVFREDYRALLFKHNLPGYIPKQTGFELASFTRREAEAFLTAGPRQLDARGVAKLFAGLDRIEGTPGLYRPITLNMVGLVLERTGPSLTTDPSHLIERYLTDCITHGRARDFCKPVLEAMITSEGTKMPCSITSIAKETHLAEWQIRATLADLSEEALVRQLDAMRWEISHDFLARILARLLGRLRPRLAQRAAPWTLGIAGAGWLAVMVLAIPWWLQRREVAILSELRNEYGLVQLPRTDGKLELSLTQFIESKDMRPLVNRARFLSKLVALNLDNSSYLDLEPLQDLPFLQELSLKSEFYHNIAPLSGMQLTKLKLPGRVMDLEPLRGMPLEWLDLYQTRISNLEPLRGMPLKWLNLSKTRVNNLDPLRGMQLEHLDINGTDVSDLAPLKGMPLVWLDASATEVIILSPLSDANLSTLIVNNTDVSDITAMIGMPLQRLELVNTNVSRTTYDEFKWVMERYWMPKQK